MKTENFKGWFLKEYSWLKLKDSDVEILAITKRNVLCKKYGYRYSIYQLDGDKFIEKFDAKTDLQKAQIEFERRKDKTVYLPLNKKIKMISDKEIKTFVSNSIDGLKRAMTFSLEKVIAINASVCLNTLAELSLSELITEAKEVISSNKANNVYWNKILTTI